jgi:hypothetical protein
MWLVFDDNVLGAGLVGSALIPRTDSMAASRANTADDVSLDMLVIGRLVDGIIAASLYVERALARGLKTHSVLLTRHRLHGPPRSGSHFIYL